MILNNKKVIITGATSGIGAATAKLMASEGATVILIGRNKERGEKLEKEINDKKQNAFFYQCDISDNNQVKVLSEKLNSQYEHFDVLFNNAGIMLPSKELERLPEEEWNMTFDTNINSMFYMIKYFKGMIYKAKGCIINNGSIAGMQNYSAGRSYAYSASKSAVIQMTRQMAKNYALDGIRVNCICPGIIDTPILGDRDRKIYAERIPLGYVGQPDDVAKVVLFLASDAASYLTGVVLPVDGGASL